MWGITPDLDLVLYGGDTRQECARQQSVYRAAGEQPCQSHAVITLHNGITRNRTDLVFKGEGAECSLNGCVIADKSQHVDNNTLIDHQVGHCSSHELYKYVLDDKSTVGAFAGRVLVRHGAQKTTSQEDQPEPLCHSSEARMYTQPMLEIYADDVKCSHGSPRSDNSTMQLFFICSSAESV
jgi:Fe-S cluster assembly protein SufD